MTDPVTFEIVKHRLWQINDEQGIAIKTISASPIVVEGNDFNVGLFTRDAELVTAGIGSLVHVTTMGDALSSIIDGGESIEDGDIFMTNDPFLGALHQNDVVVASPLFRNGDIFMWIGNVLHHPDVGGCDAGSFCINARTLEDDPPRFFMKIVGRGEVVVENEQAFVNNSRLPDAVALVDRARASGLLRSSFPGAFLQRVHHCAAHSVGAARHRQLETTLLTTQLDAASLSAELALQLAEHGLQDARLAQTLTDLAGRPDTTPARAARLFRAARSAGGAHVSAALADALATSGDLGTAGRLAEELLASEDRDERLTAVRIAAAVAAHNGAMVQAADLYRWLGPQPDPVVAANGILAGFATGDLELARSAFGGSAQGPPTSASRAARCLGDGVLASVDQPYLEVMSVLGRALGVDADRMPIGVDSAAAVAALAALHGGDPVRARSVLARALHGGDGPAGHELSGSAHSHVYSHRHRLLQGWLRMQDGQLRAAGTDDLLELLAEVVADAGRRRAQRADASRWPVVRRARSRPRSSRRRSPRVRWPSPSPPSSRSAAMLPRRTNRRGGRRPGSAPRRSARPR
mgnify:CR=1 FL=1